MLSEQKVEGTNLLGSESEVAQFCPTLCDPMIVAYQVPPSMGFSRQEYWSGVPLQQAREAWLAAIHGVTKSRTQLSD